MGCQRTSTNSRSSLGKVRQKQQISQTRGQEQHLTYTQLSLQDEDERKYEKQFMPCKTSTQAMGFPWESYKSWPPAVVPLFLVQTEIGIRQVSGMYYLQFLSVSSMSLLIQILSETPKSKETIGGDQEK